MKDQASLQLDLTDNGLSHNLAESTDSLQNKMEKNHNSSNRVEKAIAAEPIESHQDDDLIQELEEKGSNLQDTRIFDIRFVYEAAELKSFTVERSQPSSDTAAAKSEPTKHTANGAADMCNFMINHFSAMKQSLNVDDMSTPKRTGIQRGQESAKKATTSSSDSFSTKPKAAAKRNSISKRSVDKTEVDESEYEPNQSKGKTESKTVTCTSTESTETSKSPETPSSPARLSGDVDAKKSGRRSNERENSASLADTVSLNDSVSEYSDGNGSVHYQPEEWPPEIIDLYEIVRQLGSGSFGHVYLVSHRDTLKHMAIKRIKRNLSANMLGYVSNERIDFEVNVMRALTDPNIIKLHNVYSKGDYVYMMMEFMAGGALSGRIDESAVLDEDITKFYLRQLCSGLDYMHNRHLAHFDLKPDNLLLLSKNQRTTLKVADFGMCKSTRNGPVRPNYKGTIYSAPEVVNHDMCTCAADIWSIGVIMVVMLCGNVPFENISDVRAAKFDTKMIQCIAEAGKIFLTNIFKDDPKSRPDIGLLLSDTWLL